MRQLLLVLSGLLASAAACGAQPSASDLDRLGAAMKSAPPAAARTAPAAPAPRAAPTKAACLAPLPSAIRRAVRARLRDPDSARFGAAIVVCGEKFGGRRTQVVCGTVNARNGFGGYAGAEPYLVLVEAGFVDVPASRRLWNRFCAGAHASEVAYGEWMMQSGLF